MRQTSRRTREGSEAAKRYLQDLVENGTDNVTEVDPVGEISAQERLEMDRAYGSALSDGEFEDDNAEQLLLPAPTPAPVQPQEPEHIVSLRDRWMVYIKEDHKLEYPDLNLEVYVCGIDGDEPPIAEWMVRSGCRQADDLMHSDLVIFTGGPDVDPQLYSHKAHETTRFSAARDQMDLDTYWECYLHGIPTFGICRGAQFLHVMNGGTLYQDIDGHQGDHRMIDLNTRNVIERVSSVHHQSVMYNKDMEILGTSVASSKRVYYDPEIDNFVTQDSQRPDIEAFFYAETASLGVQGHPEYRNYNGYSVWCLKQIERYVIENPDIAFTDNYRRLRPDILAMRDMAKDK